jgi:hypothetical protein
MLRNSIVLFCVNVPLRAEESRRRSCLNLCFLKTGAFCEQLETSVPKSDQPTTMPFGSCVDIGRFFVTTVTSAAASGISYGGQGCIAVKKQQATSLQIWGFDIHAAD